MSSEKIKVVTVTIKKTSSDPNKPWTIREVTDEQGRKFDSFDEFKEGEEAEVIVTPNANEKYNANIKRVNENKGGFPKKDWGTQKKITALECAARVHQNRSNVGAAVNIESVLMDADKFLNWLNK